MKKNNCHKKISNYTLLETIFCRQHLTNEDFRKMLMTPRVSSSGSASSSTVHHGTKQAVTQHKKPV